MASNYGEATQVAATNAGGSIGGAIVGGAMNILGSYINNKFATVRENQARNDNFTYGEMAAENAQQRTIDLYNQIYSPSAQVQQLKDAGLSPSLFYGQASGMQGQAGPQGGGPGNITPNVFGIDLLQGAQLADILASAKLKNAQATNTSQDTMKKAAETKWQEFQNSEYWEKTKFLFAHYNIDGQDISLYELAGKYYSYEDFEHKVAEFNEGALNEYQSAALRDIFKARSQFNRDIAILSTEQVDAGFQMSLITALQKEGFAEQNATTAVSQLRAAADVSNLTSEQKGAWLSLLNDLEQKHGTTAKNIMIVISMILNNALSNYNIPAIRNNSMTFNNNNKVQ